MVIAPVSAPRSPVMMRKRVDLPAPLRPTRPAFVPAGSETLAWSRRRRPAMRAEISLIVIMPGVLAESRDQRKSLKRSLSARRPAPAGAGSIGQHAARYGHWPAAARP